jgi:VWFA-related protein
LTRGRTLLVPVLAAALTGADVLSSATPSPEAPERRTPAMVERATVELVLIEAYVTDSQGRPLRGLTPDDFSLMVDGHAKPIHSLEFREIAGAAPAPEGGPAAGTAPESARTPAARLPRRFILFFEDSTSAASGLTAARQAAQRFLDGSLVPDDQVALASYDRRLRILHDFTTDRTALRQAVEASLKDLNRFTDYASDQAGQERELATVMAQGSVGSGGSEGQSETLFRQLRVLALNYAAAYTPRTRDVLRALTTLVDSLAPYPGYKGIVFMGDGVAENPALDFLQRFAGRVPPSMTRDVENFDLSLEIKQLAHYASAAGVTLHSVQTTGLTSTTAEMRAAGRRSNALDTLALNTGGTKSSSNDLFKGLAQAESASRAYYVIGYAPEGPPDGQYHTVQLRLKHRSGNLRWRRGFTRLLPAKARERAVAAAYALPELYDDLGLEISAVAGPGDGARRVYDVVVHVPPGRVLFVPRPEGATAQLEAGYVLIDDSRRETLRAALNARITVAEDGLPGRLGVDFYSRIRVPRAGQTITAVVSDQSAGALGAARLAIPPAGDVSPPGALGLSIYSLSEKSLWVELPPGNDAPTPAETAAKYTIGPALKTTFAMGEPIACGFRLEEPGAAAGIRLVIRDGDRDVRGVDVAPPAPGDAAPRPGGSIKVRLPVEGLPAGDYVVVVRRKGAGGADADAGSAPLRLRVAEAAGDRAGPPGT